MLDISLPSMFRVVHEVFVVLPFTNPTVVLLEWRQRLVGSHRVIAKVPEKEQRRTDKLKRARISDKPWLLLLLTWTPVSFYLLHRFCALNRAWRLPRPGQRCLWCSPPGQRPGWGHSAPLTRPPHIRGSSQPSTHPVTFCLVFFEINRLLPIQIGCQPNHRLSVKWLGPQGNPGQTPAPVRS